MSCEYLIASLPALAFGEAPPLGADDLIGAASGKVAPATLSTLRALLSGEPDRNPFAVAWDQAETQIRNAVARARAARLGLPADAAEKWLRPHAGPWRVTIEESVAAAFALPDPLERHRALLRLRWDLAGELAGLAPFSEPALFAYAVRLKLLLEFSKADPQAGMARLKAAASARANH